MQLTSASPILYCLAILPCIALGCAKEDRPEGLPELQPTVVKLVQGDAPLANASIRLIPQDSSNRWSTGGTTDENGEATLRTHGKYEGAPLGEYKVTVSKIESDASNGDVDDPSGAVDNKTYQLVDLAYQSEQKTPAKVSVSADQDPVTTIDVGAPIKKTLPKL
ncbi:carboxypeptidase-like regulatory domain-containing protein [Allorhodopirellula solitaria]|uniref:Carboxypeptidase regulatory-like domain-containing protein n=1 Tax=Allorhodopirellula solitaria TaxID=2527987 RepID=A0A5C5YHM3_9BACT|nr:carboxypeptidase-like regulatory domain-containing protein [Allorhodopirellula solitaria]TWT73042.1 hypothetical protein CA85_15080 [Allorhodopirellula solitaria]